MYSHRLDSKFVSAIDNAPRAQFRIVTRRETGASTRRFRLTPSITEKSHAAVRYLGAVNGNDVPIGIRSVLYSNGIDGMNDM